MQDRYFTSFRFDEPKPPFTIIPIERETKLPSNPRVAVILDDLFEDKMGEVDLEIVDEPPFVWNRRQVRKIFIEQLAEISQSIGEPGLTMVGRELRFATVNEMRPQTKKQKQQLLDFYGEYMKDGGVGDCNEHEDGTFTLRVAFGRDLIRLTDNELSVAAHEYGHTLGGRFIEDLVFEEVKADAFEILFMKHFYNAKSYDISIGDGSNVHEMAGFKLGQLVRAGVPEETVIAHLIERQFGRFHPEDYIKYTPQRNLVSERSF